MNILNQTCLRVIIVMMVAISLCSCQSQSVNEGKEKPRAEYFLLRPELEKTYGYTQAVKVGNILKIGGVISIDDKGMLVGKSDYAQQMSNCYASLERVLKHYGCTFDDVVLENIYTTSIQELQQHAAYRTKIYTKHFPTGSWIGVKELGLPDAMIEIEMEVLVP
ncbi:RidA family protein [Chitinophaga rhizophila]|uniref:RidA family protein n=1 Tax=Chitinophaga rhizophila TaxID=2866212 RepID=A0ABS7GD90_9BACT|nr:RidA family protein [Chitinophaga rhizophila]MBW8684779.1 RidA family protein [Chitinophaga rhizophila]